MAEMTNSDKIAQLQKLQGSKGWGVIVEDLFDKLDKLENSILGIVEPEWHEVKFTQWDIEKQKRAFLKMLENYPQTLIDELTPIEDPDPVTDEELIAKASENMMDIW